MNRYSNRRELDPRGSRGVSLSELLVVMAILGIAVAIGVPIAAQQMRMAKIRGAADQLAMNIRAARMIAVSTRADVDMTIDTQPTNGYEYTDNKGKLRRIEMPDGVRITSSDSPLTFHLNGSLDNAATTILEIDVSSSLTERWTISTTILGVSKTEYERISS